MKADLINALIAFVPVIGGAIIAVIGGLVGTKYAHKLSNKDSGKALLRKKLELLVTESYEIELWLKKQEAYYLYGGSETIEKSPLSLIETLETLYFPELSKQVADLSMVEIEYRQWIFQGGRLRLLATPPVPPPEYISTITGVYSPLKEKQQALIEAAKELSKTLTEN